MATAITIWAVLGELGTMFAVFDEIRAGETMPVIAVGFLGVLLGSCGLLLLMMS